MNPLKKYIEEVLSEAERSFYVKSNKLNFTRGQEHVSIDITKIGPRDIAHQVIGNVCIVNAFVTLQQKLGREPSIEEVAEEADDNAYTFALKVSKNALHMGHSDFKRLVEELLPGLDEHPPEVVNESAKNAMTAQEKKEEELEKECKIGRQVRWYSTDEDKMMIGNIISVKSNTIKVNDTKFDTDKVYEIECSTKIIRKVSQEVKGSLKQFWPKVEDK